MNEKDLNLQLKVCEITQKMGLTLPSEQLNVLCFLIKEIWQGKFSITSLSIAQVKFDIPADEIKLIIAPILKEEIYCRTIPGKVESMLPLYEAASEKQEVLAVKKPSMFSIN